MKRNTSLIVLACEIAMIVILHSVRIYQAEHKSVERNNNTVSKNAHSNPAKGAFLVLGLK
jgi:hypothetical protein